MWRLGMCSVSHCDWETTQSITSPWRLEINNLAYMGGSRNLHGVCKGRSEEDNREGSASLDWGYEQCRQVMLIKQFWLYVSNYCTISVFQHGSSVGIVLHHWPSLETASALSTILSETASVVTTWITPNAIVFAWNPLSVASSRFKMNERDWVLKPYPMTAIGREGIKFWGRRPRNCWMNPDVAATPRRHSVLRPSPSLPRPANDESNSCERKDNFFQDRD